MEPIDIVIPWVDGNDPKLLKKRSEFLKQDTEVGEQGVDSDNKNALRWEDFQELKFCIKSIEKFAPWVRRVYILTDGQELPSYLPENFVKEKVELVDHKDSFAGHEQYLPTFNSTSIATSTINIDGLSDKYLIFNDDIFFTKPVTPQMFFDETGKSILRGKLYRGQKYMKELLWNQHMNNAAKLAGFEETEMFRLAHCCHPIDKTLLSKFREENPKIFDENMSYKFRNKNQFTISSLSVHLALKANRAVISKKQDWVMISASRINTCNKQQLKRTFLRLKDKNCHIACVNDLKTASKKLGLVLPFIEEMVSIGSSS